MFIAALFTMTKLWNQPNGLVTDKWIRKTQCIYMMRYYSAIINSELLPFSVICMELEEGMNFSFLGYHLEAIESSHGNTALMVLLLIPHIITPSLSISPKTVNHWHLFSERTITDTDFITFHFGQLHYDLFLNGLFLLVCLGCHNKASQTE